MWENVHFMFYTTQERNMSTYTTLFMFPAVIWDTVVSRGGKCTCHHCNHFLFMVWWCGILFFVLKWEQYQMVPMGWLLFFVTVSSKVLFCLPQCLSDWMRGSLTASLPISNSTITLLSHQGHLMETTVTSFLIMPDQKAEKRHWAQQQKYFWGGSCWAALPALKAWGWSTVWPWSTYGPDCEDE